MSKTKTPPRKRPKARRRPKTAIEKIREIRKARGFPAKRAMD
jgi:hypothetical protein